MTAPSAAVEAVWRIESGRLVAALARITGDFSAAEDLAQDALEIALRQWPRDGIPDHPGSWLMATAKHVAADQYRRRLNLDRKLAIIAQEHSTTAAKESDPMGFVDENLDTAVHDDLLRLVFTACHPVLSIDSQVALTLRTLGGLQTREIARGFCVSETTMGQRISRAKKTLTDKHVRFELPPAADLPTRLGAVLGVIYLIFNEGYSATAGDDWTRPALCQEALRLGRVLSGLQPEQPETHGLLALMELQASRLPARTGSGGGPYTVQAAIAACHAQANSVEDTDWRRVAALYTALAHFAPSPVVLLNRAVAVGMADGPARGLELADQLQDEPLLADYPQLPAVRGTFLQRLGHLDQARAEFERAADRTHNAGERRLYLEQVRGTQTEHQQEVANE